MNLRDHSSGFVYSSRKSHCAVHDKCLVCTRVEEFGGGSKFGAGRIRILHLNFAELSAEFGRKLAKLQIRTRLNLLNFDKFSRICKPGVHHCLVRWQLTPQIRGASKMIDCPGDLCHPCVSNTLV
jgi:hypothetical protein